MQVVDSEGYLKVKLVGGPVGPFVPYTGATGNVDLGTHTLSAKNIIVNHASGSGVAVSITKGGSGEALTVVKTSGSGNAMSVTGGNVQFGAGFYWDNTNERLGIGTGTPTEKVHVFGGAAAIRIHSTTNESSLKYNNSTTTATIKLSNNDLKIELGSSERARIFSNGNVLIQNGGTFTDAGFRLDVNGTARVVGSTSIAPPSVTGALTTPSLDISQTWNTTGTPTALLVNVTDTASNANSLLADIQLSSVSQFRVLKSGVTRTRLANYVGGSASFAGISVGADGNNESLRVQGNLTTTASGTDIIFTNLQGDITATSGNRALIGTTRGFAPTSGNATYTLISVLGTINQTGGANGITRGIHINNSLISAADWRSIEWSNNTGWGLFGAGTANNYLNGNLLLGTTTNAGFRLDVNGTARVSGQTIIKGTTNNDTTNIFRIEQQNQNGRFLVNASGQTLIIGDSFQSNENFVNITRNSFNPTSGTATHTSLFISPTINQTGGANGITRGLFVNPTLTAAADFRAIETARGNVVFGNLPTSPVGLPMGAIWNNLGILSIV
jgi:hypothetical protein